MLGAALLMALCWNLAYAKEIKGLTVSAGATGTRAELLLDAPVEFSVISLSGPDRLVIDLPGVELGSRLALPSGTGIVRSVRSGRPVSGTTRIVFDLQGAVVALKPRLEPSAEGARLVVEWPGDGDAGAVPAASAASAPSASGSAVPDHGLAAASAAGETASQGRVPGSPALKDSATHGTASDSAAAAAILAGLPATAHRADVVAQPGVDPVAASADATSRLIASLPGVRPVAPGVPSAPVATASTHSVQLTVPSSGRIATGIPTRVATGVPAKVAPAPEAPTVAAPQTAPTGGKTLQDVRGGMRPLVIAIDPGHGGQDPGAVGLGGRREKDVTLAISRELARQINATPGLKAYLTRDSDVFIPLEKRARLARSAKADMFISIHADAAENRKADGSSVYVLSLRGASSQRARWLADKENASDLIGGARLPSSDNTLTSVLLDLNQSGTMKASEDAAKQVLSGLQQVGNVHKRNIEHANFAVLRTSDMPAMLVETAFISNPEEERRLGDPAFQRTLAGAVLDGINAYFTRQPPPGTLYAAKAASAVRGAAGSP